jgi:hypothetical protein
MVEYASVRSSLYDIDSLVSQLNERSGDGWEVVQILPTGGDVTAVLRRSDEPVAAAGANDTAGLGAAVAVDEEADAGDVGEALVVEEMVADPVTEEPVIEEIAAVEEPVIEEPVVEEPAGWAAAPVVADAVAEPETTPDEVTASAGDTSTYAPVAEETPAPEPEPVAAAAAMAAEPTPAPAPPSPPPAPAAPSIPAGWYPDPSGRFELRYWDGNAWSEHTARQGQMYTDPPVA